MDEIKVGTRVRVRGSAPHLARGREVTVSRVVPSDGLIPALYVVEVPGFAPYPFTADEIEVIR